MAVVEATIKAASEFSEPIESMVGRAGTYFNLVLEQGAAAWNGTIRVQRSFSSPYHGSTALWKNLENPDVSTGDLRDFTPSEVTIAQNSVFFEPEGGVFYRVGCEAGDYTSGQLKIRISF